MAMQKSKSPRRREVRKQFRKPQPKWFDWARERHFSWLALFLLTLMVVGGSLAVVGRDRPRYEIDQVLREPVVARVKFSAEDRDASKQAQQRAKDRTPAVYSPNTEYLEKIHSQILSLGELGTNESIADVSHLSTDIRESLQLSPQAFAELRNYLDSEEAIPWPQLTDQIVYDGLASIAVLAHSQVESERNQNNFAVSITVQHPKKGDLVRRDETLISLSDDREELRNRLQAYLENRLPPSLQKSVTAILLNNPEVTYSYNEKLTEERREQAAAAADRVLVKRYPGDLLVQAGNRLGQLDLELLRTERQAYREQMGQTYRWLQMASIYGVVLLIGVGIWVYVVAYQYRIARNPWRGGALLGLILLVQTLAVVVAYNPPFVTAAAASSTVILAIILAIVYDQRFALAVSAINCLLIMLTLDAELPLLLVTLTGVAVAVAQLHEVNHRSKLLWTGFWSGAAMAVAAIITSIAFDPPLFAGAVSAAGEEVIIEAGLLERIIGSGDWSNRPLNVLANQVGQTLLIGLGAGLLIQGILPGIEHMFKVTTAMTLRELNDASLPLLSRLAQDAPGTYQHSLRIADMAEGAAQAIGANALLCRVGSMYHDIGKINKPMYFVENQGGGPNRHNKLSPAMSVLIIVGHVKDGIELAREFSLPQSVRQFIETHHGTTLVEYFYHAARKQSDAQQMPAPNEFEFRYPGPKPQTKEAAILMICDGVEGAARTLPEPTPVRLEQLVHAIANKRLMDGQFEDCNLTLAELNRIEEAITKTLCAVYHARVKYPGQDKKGKPEDAAAKAPALANADTGDEADDDEPKSAAS